MHGTKVPTQQQLLTTRSTPLSAGEDYNPPSISSRSIRTAAKNQSSTRSGRARENGRQSPSPRHRDSFQRRTPSPTPTEPGSWTASQAENVHLHTDDPGHWVINHHLPNLVFEVRPPKWHPVRRLVNVISSLLRGEKTTVRQNWNPAIPAPGERRFRVSFAEVQRMKVRKLQCQVVNDVIHMRGHGREAEGWEENLEKYGRSIPRSIKTDVERRG